MSILKRISNLQIHGSFRSRKCERLMRERGNFVFDSLLPRLAFKLKDLLNPSVLYEEGHVFLGFTKNGQFVLSYTLVDNPHIGHNNFFKYDTYTLHFWLFVPSRPLKKVGEVQLFGSELTLDLESNGLRMAVCQWPTEHNKILIYGCNRDQWSQPCNEEVECFITIASVPPLHPCQQCISKNKTKAEDQTESQDEMTMPKKRRCLRHSFVVQLQYHLLPPFPPFIPKMCLRLKDGTVVFNTGDAIYALTVCIYDKLPNSSELSPKHDQASSVAQNVNNPCIRVKNSKMQSACELEETRKHKQGAKNVDSEYKENIVPESSESTAHCDDKVRDRLRYDVICGKSPGLELFDYHLIYVQQEDLDCEDESCHSDDDIIYNNHLSLEVCGSYNTRMKILPKSKAGSWNKECICVKHQVCQVESFVNAMVEKLCSTPINNKNMVFVDYYTQILDICPVSGSVFIIVQLLFEAKENHAKRPSFSWYKCSFCFQWKPANGICHLLHNSSVEEINSKEKDRIRRNGPLWDPESLSAHTRYIESLRPPPLYMQSVKVLTNEPVLRNESLKIICEPYHGVALVL